MPTYKKILAVFKLIVSSFSLGNEAEINLWNIPNSNPITIPVEINNGNNYFISFYFNLFFITANYYRIFNLEKSSLTLFCFNSYDKINEF